MSWPDLVNGGLEASSAIFVLLSVRRLYRDKVVRGVSWVGVLFFALWAYWNLFYYPHLGQWFSLYGSLGLVVADTVWFCQIVYYTLAEQRLTSRGSGRIM